MSWGRIVSFRMGKEARFVYPPVHLLILSFQRAHA